MRPRDWDPLHGGDPVPGDPDEVQRLSRRKADVADAIREQVRHLNNLRALATWEGASAVRFQTVSEGTVRRLEGAEHRYRAGAEALQTYWPVLEHAQHHSLVLLRRAQDLREAERQARRRRYEATMSVTIGGQPALRPMVIGLDEMRDMETIRAYPFELMRLRFELSRLTAEVRHAGDRAAQHIVDVARRDGLSIGPWHGTRWFRTLPWLDPRLIHRAFGDHRDEFLSMVAGLGPKAVSAAAWLSRNAAVTGRYKKGWESFLCFTDSVHWRNGKRVFSEDFFRFKRSPFSQWAQPHLHAYEGVLGRGAKILGRAGLVAGVVDGAHSAWSEFQRGNAREGWLNVATTTTNGIKNPLYAGTARIWIEVVRAGTNPQIDWSPKGIELITSASPSAWGKAIVEGCTTDGPAAFKRILGI